MSERAVTNILLAIIAGVLLFGREAMSGTLRVAAFIAAALIIIALVGMAVVAWIGKFAEIADDGYSPFAKAIGLAGLVAIPLLVLLFGWTGMLWLEGDSKPLDTVIKTTWAGTAWMWFLGIAVAAVSGAIIWTVWKYLSTRYNGPLPFFADALRIFGRMLVLPWFSATKEWRFQREQGGSRFGAVMSTLWAAFVGVIFWWFIMMLLFLVPTLIWKEIFDG